MQPFKRRGDEEQSGNRRDPRRSDERSDEQRVSEPQEETAEGQQASEEQEAAEKQRNTVDSTEGETVDSTEGEEISTTVSEQGSQPETQGRSGTARVPEWNPSIDVLTKGEDFVIRAALPGVSREEVKITLSGGVLTFSGEGQAEDSSEGYRVREIQRGPFRRSVSLPADRDPDKVKAALENGVLEITVQGGAAVTNEVHIGG